MLKESEITSDFDSTKCDLNTALDTDSCSDIKKSYKKTMRMKQKCVSVYKFMRQPKRHKKVNFDFKIYWRTNS